MSEILTSVLQTVQKQFTYRPYRLTDLYRRQCAEYTYSVHTVYYKDILSYQYTLCTVCTHFTLCTHIHTIVCGEKRCSRFYIGRICDVMDVRCMVSRGSIMMCLEESFCPFTRDALNFRQPKMSRRTVQQCSGYTPSTFITVTLRSIIQLPLMLTGKPVRSNNAPPRKVCVTLVYLFLFAVELLCYMIWAPLVKSPSLICSDNTCLLDVSLHRIISSHWFTRSDEHYNAIISLYEWMPETRVFL